MLINLTKAKSRFDCNGRYQSYVFAEVNHCFGYSISWVIPAHRLTTSTVLEENAGIGMLCLVVSTNMGPYSVRLLLVKFCSPG